MRICSLLPGATEVVAALGRARHLVGISHECDYPPEIRTKPVLVRTTVDVERLSSAEIDRRVRANLKDGEPLYELDEILFGRVRPNLVITQDLCHACAVTPAQLKRAIHALRSPPRVLTLSPSTLDDVLADLERIGDAIGRVDEASVLVEQLRSRLEAVLLKVAHAESRPRVVCLEWLDPLYAAGHWVPEMVACAGGVDVLGAPGSPSAQIAWEQVQAAQPDALIIMPCGFSIARATRELDRLFTKPGWTDLPAVRDGSVFVVDAPAYFNRPGPRLIDGVEILAACLFPSLVPDARPEAVQRLGEQHRRAHSSHTPVS
jgi:iron complex transport system substrate-binding protein